MNVYIAYLGYLTLGYLVLKVGVWFFKQFYYLFIASPMDVSKCGGNWALVTGSTDGIGKAYAMAMAKKGLDVILVSRTPFKLQNVAADIESKYNVKTKIIVVDFGSDNYMDQVAEEIKDLKIGVLVNNVGMSYEHPEEFLSISDEYVRKIIACNITALNTMIRLVLPQMVERKKGIVINISSLSGMFTIPLLSVYAASKAYVDNFTRGLEYEYGRNGITIQCILPGYVVSNMSKLRKPTLIAPTPEVFVKSALSSLGIKSRTTGYWSHDIMAWAMNFLPEWLNTQFTYNQLKAIRAKALKKKTN